MKVAVIGAGITGLAAALELCKNGVEVELLEAGDSAGGIAGTVYINGTPIEKYYHHFFKSDIYIAELIKELKLTDKVRWLPSSMGFFVDNALYRFGTPVSLIGFKPLSFLDKLRFGIGVLKIMGIKDWTELEKVSAHDWLSQSVGARVYEKVWKPLLTSKFGHRFKEVSMAWFWGKIKLRGSSKENGREVLGYIDGSMKELLDAVEKELIDRRARLRLNCRVSKIEKSDSGYLLKTAWGDFTYDKVICTAPLPIFLDIAKTVLPGEYIEEKSSIEYTSVACTVLILNRSFSEYYWMNIGDESIPFGGLIEHTNLLDKEGYGDKQLLYISNYLFSDSKYYSMDDKQLVKEYIPHLKRINPEFDESWIEDSITFRDLYAQPVIPLDYSALKPAYKTPAEGLYTASMCSIYPEDRGVNYAVREGINVAKKLLENKEHRS
ncbi:MAG: NAD(P)/FAD-dependent oxidoreductase [Bacillota bacterium]